MPEPHWGVLKPDGVLVKGLGPLQGTVELFAQGIAAVLFFLGDPPIYISGKADLVWTVTKALGSRHEDRAWGIAVPEGSRVWLVATQEGRAFGVGPTLESVEEAVALLHNAQRSERHGRDRQDRARAR